MHALRRCGPAARLGHDVEQHANSNERQNQRDDSAIHSVSQRALASRSSIGSWILRSPVPAQQDVTCKLDVVRTENRLKVSVVKIVHLIDSQRNQLLSCKM